MSDNAHELVLANLKERGFVKRKGIFQRNFNGIENLACMAKSRYASQVLLDIGVLHPLVEHGDLKYPLHWHINVRADTFAGSVSKDLQKFLDATNDDATMIPDERASRIKEMLEMADVHFFGRLNTTKAIEAYALGPPVNHVIVTGRLITYAKSVACSPVTEPP
jgi:hypothetical protein